MNDSLKYHAQQTLEQNLVFCDLFVYLDTVSVSHSLIENVDDFFNTLSYASNGQAFSHLCQFQFDSKVGIHTIEQPNWFKPERFHSFAQWIASIYEQTLCANYIYATSQNTDKKTD
jgi:hypothetical protein